MNDGLLIILRWNRWRKQGTRSRLVCILMRVIRWRRTGENNLMGWKTGSSFGGISISGVLLIHVSNRKDWKCCLIHGVTFDRWFSIVVFWLEIWLRIVGTFVHKNA